MTFASYSKNANLVYLTPPDRGSDRVHVGHYYSIAGDMVEHEFGAFTITAPANAPWITEAGTNGDAFDLATAGAWHGWSIDYYRNGASVWSGPLASVELGPARALDGAPTVTMTAETWLARFLRMRLAVSSTNADAGFNAAAQNVLHTIYRNAWGASPVSPSGYPGGTSRTDAGDWTVSGAANTGAGTTITPQFQSGVGLREACTQVAAMGDLYMKVSESPAGTFSLTSVNGYEATDRTSEGWSLTPRQGSVTDWKLTNHFYELVNTALIKGTGDDAAQTASWFDGGTDGDWGNWEGVATKPGADGSHVNNDGALLLQQKNPVELVEVSIRDTPEVHFLHSGYSGQDFTMRDKVSIYIPSVARTVEAVVKGWKMSQDGTGPIDVTALVGDVRANPQTQVARFAGIRGTAGSPYRNLNG